MNAHIVAACRSAVAPRGGAFAALSLHDLAAPVLLAALEQAGLDPAQVDEVIVSNALGEGGNPARRIALAAGLPETVAGLSTDRQCAGGLDALHVARQMVLAGDVDVVVAGGVESYSRRPQRLRTFVDTREPEPYDQAPFTPWPERDPAMAQAAAALARSQGIGRAAQDDWALKSHAKAIAHPPPTGEIVTIAGLNADSFTRVLTPAHCARAPVITGSITAANTAVAADAAAFCIVVSDKTLAGLSVPHARLIASATLGHIPDQPGLSPLPAIANVLARSGVRAQDLSVAEVMEAYAVQAIACVEGAGLDPARVNLGGGALARGHPIGASGAINAVRLFHEITARGGTGLATIAAAGGIGSALLLTA
ncbi:MAG: acetyl-CoA C-acyltransferase [Sulfitobacter sp.]